MAKHDTLIKTIVGIAVACTLTMSVAGGFLTGFAMKDFNGGAQNGNGNGNGDAVRSITSIEKTNTYGLIDEYTIYYSDGTTSTFIVANGANGEQGIQGFPGENGQTPTIEIGANGHWIINGEDTGITAQGVQGPAGQDGRSISSIEKTNSYGLIDEYTIYYSDGTTSIFLVTNGADGEQGIQGFPGPAGHTPVIEIGTNGNWYIDGIDSGVSALGQNGQNGQDGRSIVSVAKTDTNGLVDTYTITYSDNTTSTFTITNGANGTNGTNGTNGQNGENGVTPHIGENGHWWIGEQDTGVAAQGQAGEDGQNGQNGENGVTPHIGGNGNWWIGETDTGVAAQGQNGQNGQNGENGVTPHIGANGNWYIGEQDTGVAAQGEQGAAGQNGQNGENGITPHIGANGNWYIGEQDTGIAAQGEQGQAGQNGADGKTLLTGTSAPANDEGSVGDSYIDVSTWTLYVKTAEDAWTSKGTFKGADGDNVTISNISTSGTGAPGTSDTYTITFSDGNTLAITVYNGADGANGTNGINGTNGNSLLTGTINPTTEGVNGDSYLNTQTWEYYVKENDTWVSKGNIQGPSGADGNKIHVGNTAPSSIDGYQLGDLYINSDTGMIYVLEQVGENPVSWSDKGSIMGPQGVNGKSAYELAKDHGYTGTEAEWLLSLVGADGLSAYELAQGNGYTGSLSEWLDSLVGTNGKSAYQIYCDNNADPDLSEADWLASLAGENGKSAYELYCDSHADPDLSQAEWLASLVGQDGQNGQDGTSLTVGDSSGLAPASTDGYQVGDSFLDTSSWNLWVVSDDGMGGLTWGSSPVGNLQAAATTHSVVFDLGDANATIASPIDLDDVVHGDTISYPLEDPELDGYLFQGWYTQEGNKWNFEKDVVSHDITLVAHWATFKVQNGVLTGCSGTGDVEIPMFFDGQMVTEIGDDAFKDNTALTSVSIPNTITSIGNSAFEGCTGLESVIIPSSVKTIEDNAFNGCTSLTYAYMETNTTRSRASGGLKSIGDYAFKNCPLRAVVVPNSVEHIGFSAFAYENYEWVPYGNLFDDVLQGGYDGLLYGPYSEMNNYANSNYDYYVYICTDDDHLNEMYYCDWDSFQYVDWATLPATAIEFGDGAPTTQTSSLYIDTSTLSNGYDIYQYSSSGVIESITLPFLGDGDANNYLGYIFGATSAANTGSYVSQSLEYLTITGDKAIASNALVGCSNLYSISITGCPEMIGDGAFKDCTNLSTIAIPYVGRWAVEPQQQGSGTQTSGNYSYGTDEPTSSTEGYVYFQTSNAHLWVNDGSGWDDYMDISDPSAETAYAEGAPGLIIGAGTTKTYYFDILTSDLYEYDSGWVFSVNFADMMEAQATGGSGSGGSGSGSNEIFFGSIFGASDYYEQKNFIPQSLYEVIILGGNGDNHDTIPENAFQGSGSYNRLQFDTLVISGNVKTIKANAFQYCSFNSVTIEETVVSIESNAFYYCVFDYLTIPFLGHNKMDSSTLFSGVYGLDVNNIILTSGNGYDGDQIYNDGFKYCNKTYSITLPENITYIGTYAFYNCLNLTSITLPSGIEAINDYAFYSCTSLTSIAIPDRVTQIGERAFYQCSNLKDVYLPNGLLTIGNSAFGYCSNIKGISLPNSLKTINQFAFFNTGLTYVVIPENVTEIKESAFLRCESLSSVLIKEGATKKIEEEAFSHCSGLKKVVIEGRVSTLSSSAFYDCENLEYISLPSNLTTLQYEMFRGYTKLETVILPNSLITVGERAFWGCTSLKSITLPNGVTTIGQYAFYECKNLNYIYFSDSLTTINNHAFERCNSLKSLVIPNSVTTIGSDTFKPDPAWKYLFNLKTYYGNSNSTIYSGTYANLASQTSGNNGDIYVVSSGTDHKYEIYVREGTGSNWVKVEPYIKGLTIINAVGTELPDAIASINHLFINSNTGDVYVSCSSQLESITLPLSSIASYFSTLPYTLKTIVINNATSIGNNAFSNDYNLETIVINGTPTTIGLYAFNNCYSLTNLSLPNTITKIDNYAFTGCRSLSGFVVPQNVESIGYQSFNGCTSLKYVYFNENLKFIVRQAFMNCTALESIALPDSIESLGIGAFDGCSSLKTLSLAKAGLRQKLGNILYDNTLHEQGKPSDSLGNNNDIFLHTNPNASTASGVTAGSVYRKIAGTWYREYLIWDDPNYADTLRAGSGAPTSSSGTSGVYVNVDNGDYYKYSGGTSTWIYAGNIDDLYNKVGLLFYHLDLSSGNNSTPKIVYECDVDTYNASVPSSLKVLSLTGSNETTLDSNLQGCANLEVVELASTMTAISDYAFAGCTSLKEISNPGNIQVIGNYAFQGTSYEEISGFDSLQTVGNYAFYQSTSLRSAEFPVALTTIGTHAFEGNINLRSVDFSRDAYDSPATVDIGESGFNGCISLQEVVNSLAIKTVGRNAFVYCQELKSINLKNCTAIGDQAFMNCYALASVVFPTDSSYTEVESLTFAYCYSLTNINLSSYVTTIGDRAFTSCYSLLSIDIRNVTSIGQRAFENCKGAMYLHIKITNLTVDEYAFNGCDAIVQIHVWDINNGTTYDNWKVNATKVNQTGNAPLTTANGGGGPIIVTHG